MKLIRVNMNARARFDIIFVYAIRVSLWSELYRHARASPADNRFPFSDALSTAHVDELTVAM